MAEEKQTRIGLIGCGFYAQNHLHAWSDLRAEGADLVAVCDLDQTKAEAAAKKAEADKKLEEAYQAVVAKLPPAQQEWERAQARWRQLPVTAIRAANHGAQRFLHDFVVGDQAVRCIGHDGSQVALSFARVKRVGTDSPPP